MTKYLARCVLSTPLYQVGAQHYSYLRYQRRMGMWVASFCLLMWGISYTFLRLEGPAWQGLIKSYAPWFSHLQQRPYRFADPVRYGLQSLWLVIWRLPLHYSSQTHPWQGLTRWYRAFTIQRNRFFLWLKRLATPFLVAVAPAASHPQARTRSSWSQKFGWVIAIGLTLICALLLVTQPFNLLSQFVFVMLLWCAALLIRDVPGRFSALMLIVLSLTVSGRYIWWRYSSTLNWNDSKDVFFGLILLAAETYSWVVLVLGYIQTAWPLQRQVAPLPKNTDLWPTVDLMIPTYNEDLSVVRPTVYAALGMDWPKDKLRIHLLDDGRRPAFREFAEQAGINYIIRPDGRHAKAGNLNHALTKTDGDLVAIFDCDHVPSRAFLQLTVGWFFRDKKLSLVQTPHHFFSPDPFERNLSHFGTKPNENSLFYGLIQDGNDLWNAAFFCGSCAILRRSAVESIGGFAVETVTEDAHTALRLHRKGFNSAYLRIPMAAGLATESLSAHIGQRIRWARGMVQIFRTDNPLLGKGLSLFQRICYVNAMMHFLAGIPRLIYLTAPLAFLVFHAYIIYAPALVIMLYVLPHMMHAALTNSVMQGAYRRSFWGEIYETVLSWYIAWPTTVALFAPSKGTFNVTAKGGLVNKSYFDWKIALPYMVLALLNLIGVGFGIWRFMYGPDNEKITVIVTLLWVAYNLIVLGGAVAVAAESRQVRHSHRVAASMPVHVVAANGKAFAATLMDYSDSGVALTLKGHASFMLGERVTLQLPRGARQFTFPAVVVRRTDTALGLYLSDLTVQQQIDFVQCTFARSDAWITAGQQFALDRPMSSFGDVVKLSLVGYKRLATYMPFPFSWVLKGLANAFLWLGSFIPRTRPVNRYEK